MVDSDVTKNIWETDAEVRAKMQQLQTIRPDLGLDVPYSFVFFLMANMDVVMCEGRGWGRTGAHTIGHNTDGYGIAGMGNFELATNVSPYTPTINLFLSQVAEQAPNVKEAVDEHQMFSATACCGHYLRQVLSQMKVKVLQAPPQPPPPPPPPVEEQEVVLVRVDGKRPVFAFNGCYFDHVVSGAAATAAYGKDWSKKVVLIKPADKGNIMHPQGNKNLPVHYAQGDAFQ
jgi:hypothetical protein